MRNLRSPLLDQLVFYCRHLKSKKSICLPELDDPRVMESALFLIKEQVVSGVYHFLPEEIVSQICPAQQRSFLSQFHTLPLESIQSQTIQHLHKNFQAKNKEVSMATLQERAQDHGVLSGMALELGLVDAVVAGAKFTTSQVIRALLSTVGMVEDIKKLSSGFLLERPLQVHSDDQGTNARACSELLYFSDCGVNIDPSPDELVDIAYAAAQKFQSILSIFAEKNQNNKKGKNTDKNDHNQEMSPGVRVAFLSFSTHGSAQHEAQQKMATAAKMFKSRHPRILSDGELQFDAAYVPEIAAKKCPSSPLQGQANCFIFPNLDAGNIAYKITQRLGGFNAYGPLLQGPAKPFCDLSRGSTIQDIVTSACITLI